MFNFSIPIPTDSGHSKSDQKRFWLEREFFKDDRAHAEDFAAHEIRRRVADVKAAGLHPLTAVGINPGSGLQFQHSSPIGTGGRQRNTAGVTYMPNDPAQDRLVNAQAKILELQAADMEKAAANASDIARINQGMTPDKAVLPAPPNLEYQAQQRVPYLGLGNAHAKLAPIPSAQTVQDVIGEPAEWSFAPIAAGAHTMYAMLNAISRAITGEDMSGDNWKYRRDRKPFVRKQSHKKFFNQSFIR